MEGTLDPFDFALAEQLHMLVAEMQECMSNQEYQQWRAFYTYRSAMADLETKKAEAKNEQQRAHRSARY